MAYILDRERSEDCVGAFARYRAYLSGVREAFPKSAFALATSDWYFGAEGLRSPHDARLQSSSIIEPVEAGQLGPSAVSIRIKLSLAGDGRPAEFFYPEVFRYSLEARPDRFGHSDWRYDEFRLSPEGRVIHEIEWCGPSDTGRWVIEASDVYFTVTSA